MNRLRPFLSIFLFGIVILIPLLAYTGDKKIDAHGYENTIVIIKTEDGVCSASLMKTGEPEKTITCEEAMKIISTFPAGKKNDE